MYEPATGDAYGAIFYIFVLAVYLYFTYAQYKIAQKVGHSDPWWAFIPIINSYQLVQMAKKEWYWFVFLLIPFVNIICFAILWMETAKNCYHSPLWGFLMILPFINFVSIGVMAFSGGNKPTQFPPRDRTPDRTPAGVS
jgi:hypothetical protein